MGEIKTLEFNIILERLSEYALSQEAKEKLILLRPFLDEVICKQKMDETTGALKILEALGSPPLSSMKGLDKILELAQKDSMLLPMQLSAVSNFIYSCKRMISYLKKGEQLDDLGFYGRAFVNLDLLSEEIERSIRNEEIDSNASPRLKDIRRRIENTQASVRAKLESVLRSKKEWFSDGYVTTRNGRLVLPLKREYKNQLEGTVIDTSSTGGTCFIEPSSVKKLQEELSLLLIDEENEVRKILYTLTGLVTDEMESLKINKDCMAVLDFAFAKAKLSADMKAIPVPVSTDRSILIIEGRHPLLDNEACVPLDFEAGGEVRGTIITGPNTGGKTVALKTIGLLSLMAQSGLHVPVSQGSRFCMYDAVLCDIGDGQSIMENLSTFSSHITNIIDILKKTSDESLVLLDELGSGTDPAEGMGLAIAILDELRKRECLFIATTHYPEIKDFAKNTPGIVNARMEFDRESLKPLYKMQIGEAGESCALYIAQRLGFPERLLKRAQKEAYGDIAIPDENILGETELNQNFYNAEIPKNTPKNKKTSLIKKAAPKNTELPRSQKFNMGDSVKIYPQKLAGIVYKPANEKGELVVQIKGKKQLINHKRVKLICPASELYPDDYDFSIIFDTVENRKARHKMEKGHQPDLVIEYEE